MLFKRRHFLVLAGFSGFGLAFLGKTLESAIAQNQDLPPAIASSPSPTEIAPSPPNSPLSLRFLALGDNGTGSKSQYDVATAMTRYHQQNPYNTVILAGDNIYTNGEIEKIGEVFEKPYESLLQQGVKFHACLGNHDIRTANGDLQLQYPGFNMLGRYYTFRQESVQFFALDTNGNANWKAQLAWLEKELSRSDAPWKIVFGHHPIYSSGMYGSNQAFIKNLTPLFQKYSVQLYINGHEHNYERTNPINGTTYLICGIGGAETRPVGRSAWTASADNQWGFAAIELYADRMVVTGIGTDNKVFDRGVIPLQST